MNLRVDMAFIYQILSFLIFINTVGAFITVFRKPRSIASIFAWMMTLVFLPGVGFLLYLFLGRGLDRETLAKYQTVDDERVAQINEVIDLHNQQFSETVHTTDARLLQKYFKNVESSPVSLGNSVSFYTDGNDKFKHLFEDIRAAKKNIHVEYYAFFNDKIGNAFLDLLIERAKDGIEVRVIFDPWGGKTSLKFFQPLIDAGGQVVPFITSRDLLRKTRLNYHLHRKIVVIDGYIGWTGGFNVGDQYLDRDPKFGRWRDTHGRIIGTAAFSLQEIFIRDWNVSAKKEGRLIYTPEYFQLAPVAEQGTATMQVVADGPDSEEEIIKDGFVKLMLTAEKRVWIQSPYLIPDDTVISALLIAVRSGVDVRIMIPCMPDHPFIYRATQFYANFLQKHGVKIYIYNDGFLHAKTLIMDDTISSFGTTNQDFRSYQLNFEDSVFVYDHDVTEELAQLFVQDMEDSTLLTTEMIKKQSYWLRFKQNFSRLLSPIL